MTQTNIDPRLLKELLLAFRQACVIIANAIARYYGMKEHRAE